MSFRMALIQMSVVGGDKSRNLARAERMIAEAAGRGSRLVLLPEVMDLGWTHPSSVTGAECIPGGEPCRRLSQAASSCGVYVCAGLTERCGDRVFNSAVIIGKNGDVLCTHRKLNELDIGHPYYAQGDRLNVVRTELGTLGLMICADGFAKDRVLSRTIIAEHIWDYHFDTGTNLIDVYINHLRNKVDTGFELKLIHTVRGVGYVLKEG